MKKRKDLFSQESSHAYGDGHKEDGTEANVTSSHVTCLSISRNHIFDKLNVWHARKQCHEF